jgi:hypothetical protein
MQLRIVRLPQDDRQEVVCNPRDKAGPRHMTIDFQRDKGPRGARSSSSGNGGG